MSAQFGNWSEYADWGDVVKLAACAAARIGEGSGVRATWEVCRQITPAPGG